MPSNRPFFSDEFLDNLRAAASPSSVFQSEVDVEMALLSP